MYDVDYLKWADYIESIFKKNGLSPKLILDLGCGTGNICIIFAKRGYEMIGADISSDMLSCANEKAAREGVNILFLNQDMANFELYGTVDAILCLMDSINYIIDKRDLKKMFKLVNNYLNPGGLFIFDINTPYKFKKVLASNVFYDVDEDIAYIWENQYDSKKNICKFDLTFFVKEKDYYKRYDEIHFERAYSASEIEKIIKYADMDLISTYEQLSFNLPTEKSERIFFVCRKKFA